MRSWRELTDALSTQVDWRDGHYLERQAPIVEEILRAVAASPGLIEERTAEILTNDELFARLAPHMNYPRILMDKFVLYIDPQDRFRVRLHRFKTTVQNGNAIEKVHYHKWHCSTVILRGAYTERQFEILDCDERARTAQLRVALTHVLNEGGSNSLPALRPHQVINESDTEPCLTMFVRGPSLQPHARIFDVDAGTFYDTFNPDAQLRVGLASMGRLDPSFH
jgi:hypothetical protein